MSAEWPTVPLQEHLEELSRRDAGDNCRRQLVALAAGMDVDTPWSAIFPELRRLKKLEPRCCRFHNHGGARQCECDDDYDEPRGP